MVPRILRIHPRTHQRLLRLRSEAEADGAYRVARRLHAVVLNGEGYTSGKVASVLKAPRSKVSEWLSNYETHGLEGLLEGYRSGRPARLNEAQRTALQDIIESGPVAYGFDCGVWTSPRVRRVIEEEFNVEYHAGHVRKLLHELGFSVQRPRRILARADVTEQDRWHRRTYPNIKKKPKPAGKRLSSPTRRPSARTPPSTPLGHE